MSSQPQGQLSRRTFLAASAAAAGSAAAITCSESAGATRPISPAPSRRQTIPQTRRIWPGAHE